MTLDPKLQSAVNTIQSALNDIQGIALDTPAPNVITFHRPSPTDLAAFCADFKLDPLQIVPWTQIPRGGIVKATDGTNLVSFPTLPATTDPATAMRYAGCAGYQATGERGLSTESDFERARKMADRMIEAATPADREDIMAGAGAAEPEAVVYGLMSATGAQFRELGSPTFGGGKSVADLIVTAFKQSIRRPGDPGAGIAG